MTQSPPQHDIGRQAVNAVISLLSDARQIPEAVKNDYGEDILVQTSHRGQMDASRIWFQVKGTRDLEKHRKEGGGLRLPIDFDHAFRWVRSLDLVVVALWDTVNKVGWYAIPRDQVDVYEGVISGQKHVTLHIDEDDLLTEDAVNRLVWRSRLEHYRMLLLSAQDAEVHLMRTEEVESQERVLTALDFTDLIGVTERRSDADGVQFRVQADAWDIFAELVQGVDVAAMGEEEGLRYIIDSACEAVNRRWRSIQPGVVMPKLLTEEAAMAIADQFERVTGVRERMEAAAAEEASEVRDSWWPGKSFEA